MSVCCVEGIHLEVLIPKKVEDHSSENLNKAGSHQGQLRNKRGFSPEGFHAFFQEDFQKTHVFRLTEYDGIQPKKKYILPTTGKPYNFFF